MRSRKRRWDRVLKPCALLLALLPSLAAYAGQDSAAKFDIAPQQLDAALSEYARQSGKQLLYAPQLAAGKSGREVRGEKPALQALDELLAGTGLRYATSASGAILISDGTRESAPAQAQAPEARPGNVPGDAAAQPTASQQAEAAQTTANATTRARTGTTTTLETVLVTAQKKVENIQKVPIAITAFGGQELNDRKIETGADLVTATPNVSFTKTNFASYNFQIRGIGTQALSVTTDPAVAISFNSTPMIRNRLFEQEYFDVERVEVLRGPQGTLYGRNATAGVVNMIPNLADPDAFEANVKGEVGNYESRRVNAMINVPLSDSFAFRVATQYTQRDGYDKNTVTGKNVNDRDLLSVRTSLAWKPSDVFNASLVWEHFQEDDMRSRTGKQLCHRDPGIGAPGGAAVPGQPDFFASYLSQGCRDGSLYDDGAYGVPNGSSLPFVLGAYSAPVGFAVDADGNIDFTNLQTLVPRGLDPYAGVTQSRNLREIATSYDPKFNASNDIAQLNLQAEVGDGLTFVSQTLYTRDQYYSTQDYARFQSNPIFNNTDNLVRFNDLGEVVSAFPVLSGGVYCDPQLGCSDRLLFADIVDADSKQWSQEFRLQSDFDGRFNFSVGANYLQYDVDESYYVVGNLLTSLADLYFNGAAFTPGVCQPGVATRVSDGVDTGAPCIYIDPNSLGAINGRGHNYFRSRNLAQTRSTAIFGEGYWQLSDTVRLTAGLRLTRDIKTTTPVPSQLLFGDSTNTEFFSRLLGGFVGYGYPSQPEIRQEWTEPTGRLVLDWSPDLSFTDSTLFYASASRGYKAGGTNSPAIAANPEVLSFQTRDPRFRAEYVNALELGMKNTLAGGKLTLNGTVFYNDYKDYQISQIVDRATLNENFDAETWGAEFEAIWRPTANFELSGNLGLLRTRIGDNQYSIDVMDRTAGNQDWVLVRPWLQLAANCIAPRELVATATENFYADEFNAGSNPNYLASFCTVQTPLYPGGLTEDQGPEATPGTWAYLLDGDFYNPETDAPNGGQGFAKNLGGNDLPNAPKITVSLSPQYTFALGNTDLTLRADLYYQGKSWARVYQDSIDRLDDWGNVNLSLTWYDPDADLSVQLYAKNLLDSEAITGTFLNSDDTGLTSNVFLQDPRIFGLVVRKGFN